MRCVGTVVRGIRTGIIKENDNLANIVVDSLIKASENDNFTFKDRDIVAITEAVVGISSGNYATIDDIVEDLSKKISKKNIGIVFPILSRNRFALILKAIARYADSITMLLSYPADEVGNGIMKMEALSSYRDNNKNEVISEDEYNEYFKDYIHPFTGINMVSFYRDLINSENCEVKFVFSNYPKTILEYTDEVIACDIHSRFKTKAELKDAKVIIGLDDILVESVNGSGYNPQYGLLGSNRATDEKLKLFPRDGDRLVYEIQDKLFDLTGKKIEVMVYGDGAFKDPVGGIWELADPVVSPFYTNGLEGTPNELKLKYLSDNKFKNLKDEELLEAIKKEVKNKDNNLVGKIETQGTTPRRLTDLIGSLCDLTSGSGDKGTPVVYIQGYFDNIASE